MANRHCSLNFEGADCFRSHPIHLHRIFCFWFSKISNHQRQSSTMHFSVLRTKTIGATEILWIILNCILIVRLYVQSDPEGLWSFLVWSVNNGTKAHRSYESFSDDESGQICPIGNFSLRAPRPAAQRSATRLMGRTKFSSNAHQN